MKKYKAIALFSGGLDSVLAVLWMKRLGYDVIPVFFRSCFFTEEKALKTAKSAGFEIKVVDIGCQLLEVIKNPKYGFGKHTNPCIDCHSLMFRMAGSLMKEWDADFLISGEVLSQRPMSQRLDAMNAVKKHSGYKDYIIRPLSQKLLPNTQPITEGWVDKHEMLDIQGRSRKRQMKLAEDFGVEYYPTPGGGCLLTDKMYSIRLTDLIEHDQLKTQCVKYLNVGRHFRISDDLKLIVGRKKADNDMLQKLTDKETTLKLKDKQGPLGVLSSLNDELKTEEIETAASILLSFSNKTDSLDQVRVIYAEDTMPDKTVQVEKMEREKVKEYWIT